MIKSELNHTSHRTYSMKAHIVLVTKYRKSILQLAIDEQLKKCLNEIANHWNFRIEAMESDFDHIHLLIDYYFRDRIDKIVDSIKLNSTKMLWKTYGYELSKVYWKERTLWSDGAFISSVGSANKDQIKNYINNQKSK